MKRNFLLIAMCLFTVFAGAQNLENLKKRAQKGDAQAQSELGHSYLYDHSRLNDKEGYEWVKKAAEQNYAFSQLELGNIFYDPKGYYLDLPQSNEQAFYWWKKAAEQGNAVAQAFLGMCYYEGKGCKTSYKDAFNWFMKSYKGGNKYAAFRLAECYDRSRGVEYSYEESQRYYEEAAEAGLVDAYYVLGKREKEFSYSKAFKWFSTAAEWGDAKCQYELAILYYWGINVLSDSQKAKYWFTKAAEQNHKESQEYLEKYFEKNKEFDVTFHEKEFDYEFDFETWTKDDLFTKQKISHWRWETAKTIEGSVASGVYKYGVHYSDDNSKYCDLFITYPIEKIPIELKNLISNNSHYCPIFFYLKNGKSIKFNKAKIAYAGWLPGDKPSLYVEAETQKSRVSEFESSDIDYFIIEEKSNKRHKISFPNNAQTSLYFKKGNTLVLENFIYH